MKLAKLLGFMAASVASPAAADGALLAALDATGFFYEEDYAQEDSLRAAITEEGVVALFRSARFLQLDAESLAEDGFGDALLQIGPSFVPRGGRLEEFAVLSPQDGDDGYVVRLNGRDYVAYTNDDLVSGANIWAQSTVVFFQMINDGLSPNNSDRFYAVYGGNDLMGVFLHPDIVPFFEQAGFVDGAGPYIPQTLVSE